MKLFDEVNNSSNTEEVLYFRHSFSNPTSCFKALQVALNNLKYKKKMQS